MPVLQFWRELPILRILIPFITGVLLRTLSYNVLQYVIIVSIAAIVVIWGISRLPNEISWKWRYLRGFAILWLFFSAGSICRIVANTNEIKKSKWTNSRNQISLAVLDEPSLEKNGRHRAIVSIFEILPGAQKINRGKALVYFPKEDVNTSIPYGAILLIWSKPMPLKKNKNPGQYDFAAYYKLQGIYYQVFLNKGDFKILKEEKRNHFKAFLFLMRSKILKILQKNISNRISLGLAEALLIGYRNDLDQSLLNAYSNTGVIHVIAISGLHLGLLYSVMLFLTSFLNKSIKKQWLQFFIVIPLLWVFSLMTGGSASVIRSAFMFTLLGVGRLIGKKGYPLNTLASAALILLCYQPNWILDIGFQLSFLAVASIMVYYDNVRKLIYFKNPIGIKCWEMISVTLSAQILTTPLLLFHFNQFPLLFLFTNLLAVPLSGWILLGEIILCLFNANDFISVNMGMILDKVIQWLNGYVILMDSVPFSVIRDIYISPGQAAAIYMSVAGFSFWLIKKCKWGVFLLLSGVMVFNGIKFFQNSRYKNQKEIMVLQIPGRQALVFIKGRSGIIFTDMPQKIDPGRLENEILPLKKHFRLKILDKKYLPKNESVIIRWEGKQIYYINSKAIPGFKQKAGKTDLIIVSNNITVPIKILFDQNNCPDWVADGTNSLWKIQEWKKEAEQLHLRFHSVSESGAFRQTF